MVWKIFFSHLAITVCVLIAVALFVSISLRDFYVSSLRREMADQTKVLRGQVEPLLLEQNRSVIQDLSTALGESVSSRVTVINPDGEVVGESARSPAGMENHLQRPELEMAREKEVGYAQRYSASIKKNMLYVALSLAKDGQTIGYVRLARPLTGIKEVFSRVYKEIAVVGSAAIFLAGVSSLLVSRRITEPLEYIRRGTEKIAGGSLNTRLYFGNSRETDSVAEGVNRMADRLQSLLRSEQREKAEAMAIAASMSEGVIAVNREERIININPAALKMLRVSKDFSHGEYFRAVVRVVKLQVLVERAMAGQKLMEEEITIPAGPKGDNRYLQVHATQLQTGHEEVVFGALLVLHDITRLRNLENNRKQFVANVSHELRTPITAIRGALETVLDSALDKREVAERFLNVALRHTVRFEQLIRDLLLLSRIEQTEETSLELEASEITEILDSAVAACRNYRENAASRIVVECSPGLTAKLNPGLFEQALVNLLNNALSYSSSETKVKVTGSRDEEGNTVIKVIDQGQGIASEHISRIFERFYRVDQDRSRETGGTGLGLAIVKHVMKLHGGWVEVDSIPGKGSVFSLIIPVISNATERKGS